MGDLKFKDYVFIYHLFLFGDEEDIRALDGGEEWMRQELNLYVSEKKDVAGIHAKDRDDDRA